MPERSHYTIEYICWVACGSGVRRRARKLCKGKHAYLTEERHPFSHVKLVLFTRLALRAPDKRKKMSSIPHANSYVNHLTGSSFVVVFQYPIYPPSPPEERAIVAKKAVTNV